MSSTAVGRGSTCTTCGRDIDVLGKCIYLPWVVVRFGQLDHKRDSGDRLVHVTPLFDITVLSHHGTVVGRKDRANPVFSGSGEEWDSCGVREAEILKGLKYFHIFYGGFDGNAWQIGHIRTLDFRTFEPNPYNPIFSPAEDPDAWDSGGLLTPQVFEVNGAYHMLYAGTKAGAGRGATEWYSGLAVTRGMS